MPSTQALPLLPTASLPAPSAHPVGLRPHATLTQHEFPVAPVTEDH